MPTDNKHVIPKIVKIIVRKLRRYEVANISFSLGALFFASRFALATTGQVASLVAILVVLYVVVGGFNCVMWACKQ